MANGTLILVSATAHSLHTICTLTLLMRLLCAAPQAPRTTERPMFLFGKNLFLAEQTGKRPGEYSPISPRWPVPTRRFVNRRAASCGVSLVRPRFTRFAFDRVSSRARHPSPSPRDATIFNCFQILEARSAFILV